MRYYHIFCCLALLATETHTKPFTLMIDPAGDAKHTGRQIDDTFERSLTFSYARALKTALEVRSPHIQVIITRMPGETMSPLQNANFANRLDVDMYLYVSFYQEFSTKPTLSLYTFSYENHFTTRATPLAWYPYDKAYVLSQPTTKEWAQIMRKTLTQEQYQKQFLCAGVFALPLAPLIGIKSPTIALEIGLKTKNDWELAIDPIVEGIASIVRKTSAIHTP